MKSPPESRQPNHASKNLKTPKKNKTLFLKRNTASLSFGTSTVGCQSITATKINHEIAEKQ
jgi:hypothetical protein